MATPIDMKAVRSTLSGFTIPPRPEMLNLLQVEMDQQEPSLKRIANIIVKDIGIAAYTLKVVNSPLFSLPRKITSIEHACMFLGLARVIQLVNSVVLKYTLSDGKDDPFTEKLWRASTNIASAAMSLAQILELGNELADELYTIGLFHNAGVALIMNQNENYPDIVKQAYSQSDLSISEYEIKQFRTSHELLSFLLAQTWGLSSELINVIAYHHSPEIILTTGIAKEKTLLALLKLSEHITGLPELLADTEQDIEWDQYSQQMLNLLEIEDAQLQELGDALFERDISNIYHR